MASKKRKLKTNNSRSSRLTKAMISEKIHFWRMLCLSLIILAIAALFLNYMLVFSGGWDDLSPFLMVLAPTLALICVVAGYFSVDKYKTRGFELWGGYLALLVSGLCFCFELGMMLFMPHTYQKTEDLNEELIGHYDCANSAEMRDRGQYNVVLDLSNKEFKITDYSNSSKYVNGSYGTERIDNYYFSMNMIIKDNTNPDRSNGFSIKKYEAQIDGDFLTLRSEELDIVRYCIKY